MISYSRSTVALKSIFTINFYGKIIVESQKRKLFVNLEYPNSL